MINKRYDGELEVDSDRGVIYFHVSDDKIAWKFGCISILRISSLPTPIPEVPLDITHMHGVSWNHESTLVKQAKNVLEKWANLQGHETCWHHPEILKQLCDIFNVKTDNEPCLPVRSEYEQGCRDHQDKLYKN